MRRRSFRPLPWVSTLTAVTLSSAAPARAQQPVVVDSGFAPVIGAPAHAAGAGPLVLIDAAHHNGHTLGGSYGPFAALLRADGYRVGALTEPITGAALASAELIVISNALPAATQEAADTLGSAFSSAEIDALLEWLAAGGALLLFIDHRPFPRAAEPLLRELGLEPLNGYALDYETWDPLVFRRADGTLAEHPIAAGRAAAERVDSVATFLGAALRPLNGDVAPLLRYGPGVESLHPDTLWNTGDDTPRVDVEGLLEGAALRLGRGRAVVFGEAGMAVAQRVGPRRQPRGMNAPVAAQNARYLLNAVHWLTGLLPER